MPRRRTISTRTHKNYAERSRFPGEVRRKFLRSYQPPTRGYDLMDLTMIRRASWRVSAGLMLSAAFSVPAFAQTIQLTESNATVIRGGTYANTNFSKDLILVTRASSDATYERRALLKFDTQNTIPANSQISSAKLTMTVAGGNGETRQISAYRISQ